MDKTTARKGCPPTTDQTMPARGRIKEEIIMSAPTARELRSYADWASGLLMMPDDEVLVRIDTDQTLVAREIARKMRQEFGL